MHSIGQHADQTIFRKGGSLALLERSGLVSTKDKLVTWHPASRHHPRMWANGRKWINVAYVLAAEAQTAAMSTAGTAAADAVMGQFNISRTLAYFIFTTM
jgi:hypothetical protein